MNDPFIRTQGNDIIINKADLTLYAAAAAAVIVLVLVIVVAIKSRKKNFIKTVPTNLKSVE